MRISRDGISRTVVLVGGYAFKFPTLRYGWRFFVQGLLCNMSEADWRHVPDERLCPIVAAVPGGWLVIMRRARELTPGEWSSVEYQQFTDLAVENKSDSFGMLAGRVVAVDYGEIPQPSWNE